MKIVKGARKGKNMGEGAERTGGEGGGDVVGVIRLMRKNTMVMFGMVLGGDVEEASVAESLKMMEKLNLLRGSEGVSGVMKIGIVLGDPARGEKAMFCCNLMTESVIDVCSGVCSDSFVEMIEGILEM